MLVLLVLFVVLLFFTAIAKFSRNKLEPVLYYFSLTLLVLLAAFRGNNVGADTISYISDYDNMPIMSFSDISEIYSGYEGYYYLSKIFSMAGLQCFIWFGFVEFCLISAISRFINMFSTDRLYSVILFVSTGLFLFSLAGLKQTLGLAMMLHAFVDFVNKKYLRTIILIIIAYLTHPVSLLSLFAFLVYKLRDKKILFPMVLLISLCVSIGGLDVTTQMVTLLGNEHFEMYLDGGEAYTKSTFFLYLLMLILPLPYVIRHRNNDRAPKFALACVILACSFQYLASFSPSLFRLSYAFLPFLFIYIPNSFSLISRPIQEVNLLKYCVLFGAIFFCLYSNRSLIFSFMTF